MPVEDQTRMAPNRTHVTAEDIRQIVEQVVERFQPLHVILFGSYAYGTPHEGSDLDVLVVVPGPPPRRDVWQIAHDIGRALPIPLQLQFMSPEEYDETKDVVGGLAYPAHQWGKVLYHAQSRAGDLGLRSVVAGEGRRRSTRGGSHAEGKAG